MRELGPLIVKCTDRLLSVLDKEQEKELSIHDYFKRFTMDSIWQCAFGVDINMQYDTENEYYDKCEIFFNNKFKTNLPMLIASNIFFSLKTCIFFFLVINSASFTLRIN